MNGWVECWWWIQSMRSENGSCFSLVFLLHTYTQRGHTHSAMCSIVHPYRPTTGRDTCVAGNESDTIACVRAIKCMAKPVISRLIYRMSHNLVLSKIANQPNISIYLFDLEICTFTFRTFCAKRKHSSPVFHREVRTLSHFKRVCVVHFINHMKMCTAVMHWEWVSVAWHQIELASLCQSDLTSNNKMEKERVSPGDNRNRHQLPAAAQRTRIADDEPTLLPRSRTPSGELRCDTRKRLPQRMGYDGLYGYEKTRERWPWCVSRWDDITHIWSKFMKTFTVSPSPARPNQLACDECIIRSMSLSAAIARPFFHFFHHLQFTRTSAITRGEIEQ